MPKRRLLFIITLFTLLLSACTSAPTVLPKQTEHWATAIDTEANLYRVDNKLFRSEQLSPKDEGLLKQHQINTIINLRFFERNEDKKAFRHTPVKLVNTPLMSWAISPQDVAAVLWQIEQAQRDGAVLIHCYHGADRTGLIAAMYRIIYQGWDLKEAKREMVEGPYGFHSVWANMENFFTPDNLNEIKARLNQLRSKHQATK